MCVCVFNEAWQWLRTEFWRRKKVPSWQKALVLVSVLPLTQARAGYWASNHLLKWSSFIQHCKHLLCARHCFEDKKKSGNDSPLENSLKGKAVWSIQSFGTSHISDCTILSGFCFVLRFLENLLIWQVWIWR